MNKEDRVKIRQSIGSRIADARKSIGMTQQQVADVLDIPQRTFSYYENAHGDIPSSLIIMLADVLEISTDELLGIESGKRKISGPKGRLFKRLDAVREMPLEDQKFVIKFLDQVIEDHRQRRKKGRNRAEK